MTECKSCGADVNPSEDISPRTGKPVCWRCGAEIAREVVRTTGRILPAVAYGFSSAVGGITIATGTRSVFTGSEWIDMLICTTSGSSEGRLVIGHD